MKATHLKIHALKVSDQDPAIVFVTLRWQPDEPAMAKYVLPITMDQAEHLRIGMTVTCELRRIDQTPRATSLLSVEASALVAVP